jgi:DnaK suppressor protein
MAEKREDLDLAHFKKLLEDREQDLNQEIIQLDETGREGRVAEVEDEIDRVTSEEARTAAFGISTKAAETLAEVRAALTRIERGEYGVCIDCGEPIEKKRLEAVPWALYCLKDQEKHDREDQPEPQLFDSVQ